ncbi:MAG: hypothetical protein U0T77_10170 [Chitinophagales bacterium]
MKNLKNIFSTFCCTVLAFGSTKAQSNVDTLPQLDEVSIVKAYEPILISSNKVPFAPNLPNIVKAKPDAQQYQYSDVKGKIDYQPEEIKPIKSAGKKPEKNQFFYAKIGFGYPVAPLLKLILTNPVQNNYRAGLDVDFMMTIHNKPKFQNYTDLKIRGFGEYFIKKKAAIGGDFFYRLNQHNFYGYSDIVFTKDSLKTNYNRFGGSVKLRGIEDAAYYYSGELNFNTVKNKNIFHAPKEFTINVNADGGYTIKSNYTIGGKINLTNVSYKDDTVFLGNQNHFTFQAIPYAKIKFKIWQLTAGPNIFSTNRRFYVLPEIINQLQIYKDYLVMYNEWRTQVKINSMYNLSLENPFIVTSNYNNSIDETRTIIGLRGSIKGFGYDFRFSHLRSRMNAQFVNTTQFITGEDMAMDVQSVASLSAWNPHFGISYNKGNQFGAKAWFDYFVYNKNTATELSYIPTFKYGFSAFYNWKDKLYVNMDISGQSKVKGVQINNNEFPPFVTTTLHPLKGLIDVNLSANYFITKNIGVFVDVNNLGFQKWPRFYKYPTYQFQVIGGVKLAF